MSSLRALTLAATAGCLSVEAHRANPIRRVVDLLQGMQDKIKKEGEEGEKAFEKQMCYCTSTGNELKAAIQAAQTKIPQVTSSLEEAQSQHAQLRSDLGKAKADRSVAESAIKEANALRQKEAAKFAKDSGDFKTNLAALGKAIAAVEKGMGGSFLQTSAAARLQQITLDVDMSSHDRDLVAAFLSQGQEVRSTESGEIVGILKQLKETMHVDLKDITAAEQKAIKDYNALVASQEKEIADISAQIEAKLAREGETGESIVMLKEDLDDTSKALPRDQKFLADLTQSCEEKTAEWEERKKLRTEEQLAIADTINMLNSDDALELFKKTIPSASFLQTMVRPKDMQADALNALRDQRNPRLEFIGLTLRGGAKNFDKVLKMIDTMVSLLKDEQKSDDRKRDYCLAALDKAEDEKKVLEQTGKDQEKAIDETDENIATVTEDISALAEGIRKLDAEVAEATQMRQDEHASFQDVMASNGAAKELIGKAADRMRSFYDFLQKPKDQGGAGVIELMNMMVADIDKEMQTSKVDEKNAQAAYEQFVQDSGAKRAQDAQTITDKEGAKADFEKALDHVKQENQDTGMATMAKEQELMELHQECDWNLANYDTRMESKELKKLIKEVEKRRKLNEKKENYKMPGEERWDIEDKLAELQAELKRQSVPAATFSR